MCYGLLSQNDRLVLTLPSGDSAEASVRHYWEVSNALTTQNLLSVISLANTLMSMSNASFIKHRHR